MAAAVCWTKFTGLPLLLSIGDRRGQTQPCRGAPTLGGIAPTSGMPRAVTEGQEDPGCGAVKPGAPAWHRPAGGSGGVLGVHLPLTQAGRGSPV